MVGERIPRLDVTGWEISSVETRGQSEKVWLVEPSKASSAKRVWLFKQVVVHENATRQAGDWAEYAVSRIAQQLGIKTAEIRLVTRDGHEGCISRHVRPGAEWALYTGRRWLDAHPDVDYQSGKARFSRRLRGASPGHSLESIRRSLTGVAAPPGYDSELSGWDIFVAYLIMDALVSNRDRHEENWSVMRPLIGLDALAPAYDMEGSLGFQLQDEKRLAYLADPTMASIRKFAERGSAWRFDGHQDDSLVAVAVEAFSECSSTGQAWLRGIVEAATYLDLQDLLRVPDGMSDVAASFGLQLVKTNVRRVQDAFGNS